MAARSVSRFGKEESGYVDVWWDEEFSVISQCPCIAVALPKKRKEILYFIGHNE